MTTDSLDRKTWSALCAAEDHFALLGGANRYPRFDRGHPAVLVAVMLLLEQLQPGTIAAICEEPILDRTRFNEGVRLLAAESIDLKDCFARVPVRDRRVIPDTLIAGLARTLEGTANSSMSFAASLAGFAGRVEAHIKGDPGDAWRAFKQYVQHDAGGTP